MVAYSSSDARGLNDPKEQAEVVLNPVEVAWGLNRAPQLQIGLSTGDPTFFVLGSLSGVEEEPTCSL